MILGWLKKFFWRDIKNSNYNADGEWGLDGPKETNKSTEITITRINGLEPIDFKKITDKMNEDAENARNKFKGGCTVQYFTKKPNDNVEFQNINPNVFYSSPCNHNQEFNTEIFTISETVKQIKKDDPLAIGNQ